MNTRDAATRIESIIQVWELARGTQETALVVLRAPDIDAMRLLVQQLGIDTPNELCQCGHPKSQHETPGHECIAIDELGEYCSCSWFLRPGEEHPLAGWARNLKATDKS